MASTISPPMFHALSVHGVHTSTPWTICQGAFRERESNAEDIPLFGFRKKLKSAEEEAVEIVKEGLETAEKGLETAERGIFTVEKGLKTAEKKIETAEKEIESAVGFGALAQAGAVAGAEFLGVVVATSIVNGVLAAEAPKS
ncbi:hypothetical protein GOBAR_DD14216 [Gossypium barbadense]|nr:hypothetical protein GOBAR_DD14216 [Gossypium barbadense]